MVGMTGPQRAAYARGYLAWPKGDPVFAIDGNYGHRAPWAGSYEGCQNIAEGAYNEAVMGFPAVLECIDAVTRIEKRRARVDTDPDARYTGEEPPENE
jgi:hypothetical protein